MSMRALDAAYAQEALLAEVSVAVLAMSLRDARSQAEHFGHIMDRAELVVQTIQDPSLGQAVNLQA